MRGWLSERWSELGDLDYSGRWYYTPVYVLLAALGFAAMALTVLAVYVAVAIIGSTSPARHFYHAQERYHVMVAVAVGIVIGLRARHSDR